MHEEDAKPECLLLHHADVPLQSLSMACLAESIKADHVRFGSKGDIRLTALGRHSSHGHRSMAGSSARGKRDETRHGFQHRAGVSFPA